MGNVGDDLIKEGSRALLVDAGLPFEQVASDLDVAEPAGKTLLIRGSGGWCTLFHGFMPTVTQRASAVFGHVVVLPSSFDPAVADVREALARPNVTAISRDLRSRDLIAGSVAGFAAVDCAVHHPRFATSSTAAGSGTLVVLREDKGSPLLAEGYRPDPLVNDDISSSAPSIDAWLDRIEGAATVVTDRLHVAVAAALMNKHMVLIDPYEEKLSAYFDFTFGSSPDLHIEWQHTAWLVAQGLVVPADPGEHT